MIHGSWQNPWLLCLHLRYLFVGSASEKGDQPLFIQFRDNTIYCYVGFLLWFHPFPFPECTLVSTCVWVSVTGLPSLPYSVNPQTPVFLILHITGLGPPSGSINFFDFPLHHSNSLSLSSTSTSPWPLVYTYTTHIHTWCTHVELTSVHR